MNTPASRRLLKLLALLFALTLVAAACNGDDDEDEGTQDEAPVEDDGALGDDEDAGADADAADDDEAADEDIADENAITAEDQESDGTSIQVASATVVDSPGFVVIHADDDGAPGEVIGHEPIPEGTSSDVTVELDREIETGTYWPMIHVDAGEAGTYEFPGPDVPAEADGEIVVVPIEVTVA